VIEAADIARIDFAKAGGLVPAIVQDADSGAVLMLGYMNADALAATLERGRVVFFSRSRQRLWEKGETSGLHLTLVDLRTDCDADALLVLARPSGPVCHLGTTGCFGDEALSGAERLAFLGTLERVIERRVADGGTQSYTARLFASGARRVAQKVGEEGLETALAGACEDDAAVVTEAADLLYHLAVLLKLRGASFAAVVTELASRHARSAGGGESR
jgi:phosphoribosyl-ATP pyrophosphohydrolase/phosphoribosyl-AMP cyclohydrolase